YSFFLSRQGFFTLFFSSSPSNHPQYTPITARLEQIIVFYFFESFLRKMGEIGAILRLRALSSLFYGLFARYWACVPPNPACPPHGLPSVFPFGFHLYLGVACKVFFVKPIFFLDTIGK
ncbi:hypothetical protein, partial [Akkermansia glycaniphila]|uniref:hypothetical protein n=1 Tax=Akkermansia glycaniphila TaxID=1679444 RepID=UPI001C02B7DC